MCFPPPPIPPPPPGGKEQNGGGSEEDRKSYNYPPTSLPFFLSPFLPSGEGRRRRKGYGLRKRKRGGGKVWTRPIHEFPSKVCWNLSYLTYIKRFVSERSFLENYYFPIKVTFSFFPVGNSFEERIDPYPSPIRSLTQKWKPTRGGRKGRSGGSHLPPFIPPSCPTMEMCRKTGERILFEGNWLQSDVKIGTG